MRAIHLLHPTAKVVLHLHAPYSTALTAIQGGRLQMIHQNAARFFGDIAYDDHFDGIAEATQEGERIPSSRTALNGMMRARRARFSFSPRFL